MTLLSIMEVYLVIEDIKYPLELEPKGVFTTKEKATDKIIELNKKDFDKIDPLLVIKCAESFSGRNYIDVSEVWNDREEMIRNAISEDNYWGFYRILTMKLDS